MPPTTRWRFAIAFALAGLGAGCGDMTLQELDPAAAPENPSWTVHVQPIIDLHCVACHDPNGQAGAQEGYAYVTCQDTRRGWDGIRETVFEEVSMPPGGAMRLQPYEELILQRWHDRGAPCD